MEKTLHINLLSPDLEKRLQCKVVDKKGKQLNIECSKALTNEIRKSFNQDIPDNYKDYKIRDIFERGYQGQGIIDFGGGHEFGLFLKADSSTLKTGMAEINAVYEPSSMTKSLMFMAEKEMKERTNDDAIAEVSGSRDMFERIIDHGFRNIKKDFGRIIKE